MKRLFLFPIKIYRRYLSKLKGAPCCRFSPSCSAYAYSAISEWGVTVGIFLSAFRILRCNPFCKGGYDPIPRRKHKILPKTDLFEKRPIKKKEEKLPFLAFYGIYIQ